MKRTSIRIFGAGVLVGFVSLFSGVQTHAEPITYSFTGTGTGTFGGQGFTNAVFTISVFADTTNVLIAGDLYSVEETASAIGVTGIGLGFFTNAKRVFKRWTYLGFAQSNGYDLLDLSDSSFSNYDLQSSFSPTANLGPQPGTLAINEPTTLGAISFTSFGNISFKALTGNPAPPELLTQPTNQTELAGDLATFGVQASGEVPIAFYWQHNGTNLLGSANPLLLSNVQADNAGDYFVVVTNMFGSVTSHLATLTVIPSPPNFTQQPIPQAVALGSTARFTAAVNGSSPVSWQWYFNGFPATNANFSQLSITNVQGTNLGNYWAVVTNSYGGATSSVVTLSFSPVLVWGSFLYGNSSLTNVPVSATNVIAMAAGDTHCLALKADGTVMAWGSGGFGQTNVPLNLTNAVSIAAGSTHSLALRNDGTVAMWGRILPSAINTVPPGATNIVGLALGPGAQHALVLKADGTVMDWGNNNYGLATAPATVRNVVAVASGATHGLALRADGKVVAWGNVQTSVPTTATNIVAIATSWYGNAALRADGTLLVWGSINSPVSGFTNILDVVCPINSFGGNSDVLALRRSGTLVEYSSSVPKYPTNNITAIAAGSYNAFAVVGYGPPVFPGMPVNRTVATGSRAYFRAVAAGTMPMSYQWNCNGTNVPGATNSVLVLTNVQPIQAGSYYTLTASNAFGMATNGAMILNEVPLEFSIQPQTLAVAVGATAKFTLAFTNGVGPFTWQWQCNNTNIDGATNSSLSLINVQLNQAGTYSLVAGNSYGNVTNTAALTVLPMVFNAGSTILAMTTNGFQFRLDSVYATQSVVIFASTNLASWLPILTNPAATGSVLFLDSAATNLPQRFYRAVEQ